MEDLRSLVLRPLMDRSTSTLAAASTSASPFPMEHGVVARGATILSTNDFGIKVAALREMTSAEAKKASGQRRNSLF